MKVVIRVDSSQQIGSGHLVRCRTLAETLRKQGAEICFICREHIGHLSDWLSQSDFAVTLLATSELQNNIGDGENYGSWLGVSQNMDALETIHILGENIVDFLIVDHYGLDERWENLLRPYVKKILVIDDLANRRHDCDLLLDQNESLNGASRYLGLVPENCQLLIGCRYALLRSEYAKFRKMLQPRTKEVRRILIFFGGSDAHNMTGLAIAVLSSPEFLYLHLDVVVGAMNPHRLQLEEQANLRQNTTLYSPRPHLADLMAQADLAIAAGGTTTWELACMGLPSIVITVAENQKAIAATLEAKGMIVYLGDHQQITSEKIRAALQCIIGDDQRREQISKKGKKLVDGNGVAHVVSKIVNMLD
jgi:UDP-2,4-diacetamido-2,4,6-trideoxy-beta-L-altropyranose hydrolase